MWRRISETRMAVYALAVVTGFAAILGLAFVPNEVLSELESLTNAAWPKEGKVVKHQRPMTWGTRSDSLLVWESTMPCGEGLGLHRGALAARGFGREEAERGEGGAERVAWSRGKYCARIRCNSGRPGEPNVYVLTISWRPVRLGGCL